MGPGLGPGTTLSFTWILTCGDAGCLGQQVRRHPPLTEGVGKQCVSILGCLNRVPHTAGVGGGALKTTDVYSLMVVEAGTPKSSCPRGYAPSASRGGSFHPSSGFWWSPAILGIPRLVAASLQSLPQATRDLTSSLCLQVSLSCDTQIIGFRAP